MNNLDEHIDVDALGGIKDLLTGLRTTILTLAEQKVNHVINMKGEIEELIKTTELMEIEKMLMQQVKERDKTSKDTINKAVQEIDKKVRKYL